MNKDSDMDTHRNKNETKQVNQDQNREIDRTHKPKSVNKDSDMDTPRDKNETKQVNQVQNRELETRRNFDKGAVGSTDDK